MDRSGSYRTASLVILAVLSSIAAIYFLKPILVPITVALLISCMLSPATAFLRRVLPLGQTGASVVGFLLTVLFGLYVVSLTAETLIQATSSLPSEIESLAQQLSGRMSQAIKNNPKLGLVLPDPDTINRLGDRNRELLNEQLRYGLAELTGGLAQGFVILVLVLFLLSESDMLTPKVIRFFARSPRDAVASQQAIRDLTKQIRAYLIARTLINLALGMVLALCLWKMRVRYPFVLGLFAAVANFVPYVGQMLGGALPALVTLAQYESVGDALIVASIYLGIITVESYIVTPYILGRSLDLNGTVIIIACLFWGFLWGLIGLVLAMPFTVCMKLIFQSVPELHRWADLMSQNWTPPPAPVRKYVPDVDDEGDSEVPP